MATHTHTKTHTEDNPLKGPSFISDTRSHRVLVGVFELVSVSKTLKSRGQVIMSTYAQLPFSSTKRQP